MSNNTPTEHVGRREEARTRVKICGVRSVDVLCPGFVADCLETLEEIAMEARQSFLDAGGQTFRYIPALNDSPPFIAALATLVERHLAGWDTGRRPG